MGTTSGRLDLDALRHALEARDAAALTALYADDADVVMVDRDHPPSSPMRTQGSAAIRAMYDDICGRAMTHELTHAVVSPGGIAYTELCRYSDGTQVLSANVCDVSDGRIRHHEAVQAWDEAGRTG